MRHRVASAVLAGLITVVMITAGAGAAWAGFSGSAAASESVTTNTLAAPTGLSASGLLSATLTWTATTSAYATGTRVFRSTTSGSGYTQIAQIVGLTTHTYNDSIGIGTFYYVVEAYYAGNGANWTSPNSNQTQWTLL